MRRLFLAYLVALCQNESLYETICVQFTFVQIKQQIKDFLQTRFETEAPGNWEIAY